MRGTVRFLHGRHAWLSKGTHWWFGRTKEGKECLWDTMVSQRAVDSGDASINPREDEEFGVPHPSGGPGRAPWRLDCREDHEKAWNPNAHIDISSPRGGSAIGLPGGRHQNGQLGCRWGVCLGRQHLMRPYILW